VGDGGGPQRRHESRCPEEYPGGRPRVRAARWHRVVRLVDATGTGVIRRDGVFRRATTPRSPLAFDAETTTLEQGRTITNDTSADGAGALLAVVDTGLTYDSDIYGRTVTVDGSETTESRVHEESTNFVAAGDPTVAAEGVDILDDASGHGSWVTAAAASSAQKAVSRRRAGRRPLHRARTRPRRRLRRRRGYRDRRSGRDGRWRGRNVHESRVTALHRGTGGRDRVRDRTTATRSSSLPEMTAWSPGSSPTRRQTRIRSR